MWVELDSGVSATGRRLPTLTQRVRTVPTREATQDYRSSIIALTLGSALLRVTEQTVTEPPNE